MITQSHEWSGRSHQCKALMRKHPKASLFLIDTVDEWHEICDWYEETFSFLDLDFYRIFSVQLYILMITDPDKALAFKLTWTE